MKKKGLLISLITLFLVLICSVAANADNAVSLNAALALVDSGSAGSERILLSDDFSAISIMDSGDYVPVSGGIIVLWRNAPLKEYKSSNVEFSDDYLGEDIGSPEVYLCADVMARIPAELRAHSDSEVKNVLMIEDMYYHTGTISSSASNTKELPDMDTLSSIIEGGTVPPDTEARSTNFRPVFSGMYYLTLYDLPTGGSYVWDWDIVDYSEMRDNPEAADILDMLTEMLNLCFDAADEETDLNESLENVYEIPESDITVLSNLISDRDAFFNYAYSRLWALAKDLKEKDPAAKEQYEAVIREESLNGLLYLANMRGYSGVSLSDTAIRNARLYIGIPSESDKKSMLEDYIENIFELVEWDMPYLFEQLNSL